MKYLGIIISNLNRGKMYISFINFALLFKIFLKDIGVTSNEVYAVAIAGGLVLTFLIGWLDKKLGIRSYSVTYDAKRNKVLTEINKKLDEIILDRNR